MLKEIASVIASSITASSPVIFASVGECISQRSGILNLGLEGVMLVGAIVGYVVASQYNSLALALLATVLVGLAIGLFYAFLTVTMRVNQSICGLALVMFGTGLSGVIGKMTNTTAIFDNFKRVKVPVLYKIPLFGNALFNQNVLVYLLYVLVPLLTWYIYRTRSGLLLRALGENPAALDAMGYKVFLLRYMFIIIGNILTAIGGAYITLAYTFTWNDGMTSGKGWIACALVVFAGLNPLKAAFGSVLFGAIEVFSLRLQSRGVPVPTNFLSMLPYITTVVVLIISASGKRKVFYPKSLGIPYNREVR